MFKQNVRGKNSSQDLVLHDALIEMGFALMEGTGVYLMECVDQDSREYHIMLDWEAARNWKNAIEALGQQFFNRILPREQRHMFFKLSQELMQRQQTYLENSIPKASNGR